MKNLILFIAGIVFLMGAGFYGFASSPDYRRILTLSLIFDFLSIVAIGALVFSNRGAVRVIAIFLIVVAVLIGWQATYRMCLL
jgi:hypothetical protein